jgi:hypothetical protein
MLSSMGDSAKPQPKRGLLVEIEAPGERLRIWDDGCGTLSRGGTDVAFGREFGRYALRQLYLGTWGNDHKSRLIRMISDALLGHQKCIRFDCKKPIPERRRLNGFQRDVTVKYCSKTCQCTEATRRWNRKRAG